MSFGNFQKFLASLGTTLSGLEKPTCENPNPFANREVPIKVLPFHGIYAFTASMSDFFRSFCCGRILCSLSG